MPPGDGTTYRRYGSDVFSVPAHQDVTGTHGFDFSTGDFTAGDPNATFTGAILVSFSLHSSSLNQGDTGAVDYTRVTRAKLPLGSFARY